MGDLLLRIKLLHLPLWVIIFDCLLATQMWALILLFCINAFTDTARGSYLSNLTSPLFWVGRFITPRFLSERAKPLYLALLVLLIRFYLLPFILDIASLRSQRCRLKRWLRVPSQKSPIV